MSLGENIAKYRKEKGFTQEALAKKLDVTNQAVSKWENNQCCPDTLLLPKIADILEVTIDALFGRELVVIWENEGELSLVSYDSENDESKGYPGTEGFHFKRENVKVWFEDEKE